MGVHYIRLREGVFQNTKAIPQGTQCSGCPFPAPHLNGAGLRHSGTYLRLNSRAARGNTQDTEAIMANLFRKECLGRPEGQASQVQSSGQLSPGLNYVFPSNKPKVSIDPIFVSNRAQCVPKSFFSSGAISVLRRFIWSEIAQIVTFCIHLPVLSLLRQRFCRKTWPPPDSD